MAKSNITGAKEKLCLALLEIGAIRFGDFKLKLHDTYPKAPLSPIYIDLRMLRRDPKAKKYAIKVYLELIKPLKFDILADIPTAATPLVSSIADALKMGQITPRADSKKHGTGAKVDGLLLRDKGKRALLIDDLVSAADSKVEAAATVLAAGLKVRDVVVLIDREQGGATQLAKRKLKLHSAFTLSEMLDFYLVKKKINEVTYKDIKSRIEELNNFLKRK